MDCAARAVALLSRRVVGHLAVPPEYTLACSRCLRPFVSRRGATPLGPFGKHRDGKGTRPRGKSIILFVTVSIPPRSFSKDVQSSLRSLRYIARTTSAA